MTNKYNVYKNDSPLATVNDEIIIINKKKHNVIASMSLSDLKEMQNDINNILHSEGY
jgi:hypothetical protein